MLSYPTLILFLLTLISNTVRVQGKNTSYTNPILPGWHSDPSCQFVHELNDTFFCTTSSFLAFPGCPIYASKDLINWKLASNALSRETQIPGLRDANNVQTGGIYASTLRFRNGTFYLVTAYTQLPDVGIELLLFTSTTPWEDEAWSDPKHLVLNNATAYDPDIFFDDDGSVIVAFAVYGSPPIQAAILDLETGVLGEAFALWNGTGGSSPEGPHLYKKDGVYYAMIAEGGTQINHAATIARSTSLKGPWEPSPRNPVVSNRGTDEYFQTVGHADLFQDVEGNWWGVALSTRGGPVLYNQSTYPLGRETVLYPVSWPVGDWPVADQVKGRMSGPLPPASLDVDGEGAFVNASDIVDFAPGSDIPSHWVFWRAPAKPDSFTISPPNKPNTLQLTASRANLTGDAGFNATDGLTLILRRQSHSLFKFSFDVAVSDARTAISGDETGISSFLSQYQHVDLGIVYLAANNSHHNSSSKTAKPHLRFRATTFGKTANFTGTVPETKVVAIPKSWLHDDVVRLEISTVNATNFRFFAGPAKRFEKEGFVVGVLNTTWVSGNGAANGGLLGAYATTNGGNHSMNSYISRWRYTPIAQKIGYGDLVYV